MHGYKSGAKRNEQNRIRELNAQGKSVEEISRALLIVESCVQSFVDKFNGKKPRKPKKKTVAGESVEQKAPPIPPPAVKAEKS